MAKFSSPPAGPLAAGLERDFCRCRLEVLHLFENFTLKKLNILSFALASDARDRTQRYIRQRDCPPPPPALLTQDSMPRERRHLAGGTWEGGLVVLFLVCSRGNVLLGAHGLFEVSY